MTKFEYVDHKITTQDQYIKSLITIRIDGKYNVTYAEKTAKSGGTFWALANYAVTSATGEKSYHPCFLFDSRMDEELALNFVRQSVANLSAKPQNIQTISKGVVADEQLPF